MVILYIVLGLIALVLVVAAVIGTGWNFERSITIHAPLKEVWTHLGSLKALNTWNPWIQKDPAIRLQYFGTDALPGARFSWESEIKEVGAGSQILMKISDYKEVSSRVDFIRPFKGMGQAYIRVRQEGDTTLATWSMISSTPYPMNIIKIFGLIEKNMDRDFSWGLNKLKELSEK